MRLKPLLLCCALVVSQALFGQSFTNSAKLTAAVDATGTNLVVRYSMTTTQGWVTLFSADRPEKLATNAQPVELAPVLPSMQGQFNVPINPAAAAQFYKLLIEQWPSRGKALVFTNGPIDFAAMRATYGDVTNNVQPLAGGATNSTPMIFRQPVEVWIDNLGVYDPETGVLVSGNAGVLTGKYGITSVNSLNDLQNGFPPINPINAGSNDFRVNYLGEPAAGIDEREAIIWSSEVQFYHDINDYRSKILNESFIRSLGLPPEIEKNLISRQFRPDLAQLGGRVLAYAAN
jgi:hypothetical protein